LKNDENFCIEVLLLWSEERDKMKIVAVEAIPFFLPLRRKFRWASLQIDLGGFVLVRIRTDEGVTGYGEATPLPDWGGDHGRRGGETQQTVVSIIETALAPVLLGRDPRELTATLAAMNRVVVGHQYAKCAIDIALHDIWGKALGVPIYKLLGGACRPAVPIAHMVGIMPIDEAFAEAAGAVEDGLGALQIKGGEDPDRDVELIARLHKEFAGKVTLRLDANQGYRQPKTAISVIHRLEAQGLAYAEQPVMGLAGMAQVTRSVAVPIIADESCWTAHDALELIETRAADCISIYLAKAGGISGAREVAAIADAAGIDCDVNGSIESGIGNAANLHFALATPAVRIPAVIPISAPAGHHPNKVGGNYYEDDIVEQAFAVRDGGVLPPEGPGLGIVIDEKKLAKFRSR
jgi:muconate cycloisomerase